MLEPGYVEKCVSVLEANPNVGLAIVNRAVIDENGRWKKEALIYNQSCIIPGEEQAAVYMMAELSSVSEIMYRNDIARQKGSEQRPLVQDITKTPYLDFNISTDFRHIRPHKGFFVPLLHPFSERHKLGRLNMLVIGLYVLNHQFADIASLRNLTKVTGGSRFSAIHREAGSPGLYAAPRSLLAKDRPPKDTFTLPGR